MGTLHTLAQVAGEFVRSTAAPGQTVTLELSPVQGGNRARGAARYSVALLAPWLTAHKLRFVTSRGYLATYQYRDLATWAAKNLPGVACGFTIGLPDASTLPAKWTPGRVAAQARRIADINGQALKDGAMLKAQSVADWAASQRKADTLAAARAMSEAAALLDVLLLGSPWPDATDIDPPAGGGGGTGTGTGGGGAWTPGTPWTPGMQWTPGDGSNMGEVVGIVRGSNDAAWPASVFAGDTYAADVLPSLGGTMPGRWSNKLAPAVWLNPYGGDVQMYAEGGGAMTDNEDGQAIEIQCFAGPFRGLSLQMTVAGMDNAGAYNYAELTVASSGQSNAAVMVVERSGGAADYRVLAIVTNGTSSNPGHPSFDHEAVIQSSTGSATLRIDVDAAGKMDFYIDGTKRTLDDETIFDQLENGDIESIRLKVIGLLSIDEWKVWRTSGDLTSPQPDPDIPSQNQGGGVQA